MPGEKKYLFDSDGLITARTRCYQPAFGEAFWSWLDAGHAAGNFFSVDKVREELLAGNQQPSPFKMWVDRPELATFFAESASSIAKWGVLSAWANAADRKYSQAAKNKFLHPDSADAWLIAKAAQLTGFKVVTLEVPSPESVNVIKLPDAATALGVETISLWDCLGLHAGANFKFVP